VSETENETTSERAADTMTESAAHCPTSWAAIKELVAFFGDWVSVLIPSGANGPDQGNSPT